MTGIRLEASPLWTAAEARAADAWTIDTLGVPGLVLMEHAGRAVADAVVAARGAACVDVVVDVVCGPGNNGGDGWVCARHLAGRGVPVRLLAVCGPERLQGDAAAAARLYVSARAHGDARCFGLIVDGADADIADALEAGGPGVVVDALYGTGLSRPLDAHSARIVDAIRARRAKGARVVAVDLPSGLPTDGAAPAGLVVDADVTVTFAGRKIAHAAEPGFAFCGEVVDVDIGVGRPIPSVASVRRIDRVALPRPSTLSHKGTWGHVAVVAGAPATMGASLLAARGAQRAGAGLVSVLGDVVGVPRPPEVMARPAGDEGISGVDVVVIGPGLAPTQAPAFVPLLARARLHGARVVADAGVIGALPAGFVDVWTPHPGEAARVLGVTAAQLQRDRLAAARMLVERLGGVVVLKGAAPVVASTASTSIVPGGAPALAVGGSGDVLAGVIGAALAGALGSSTIDDAVGAAVWLHQQAGRTLSRGALAGEIADAVAAVVARSHARGGLT